jgi:glycerophosphoryl diester phosphodiesterase
VRLLKKIKILAHRGYSAKFPENTELSFKKAMEYKADGIECDIQKTKDNKYVIIHDDSVDRTSDHKGYVKDLTLDKLKKYNFGKGERILLLEEFLKLIPENIYLDIELKEETLTDDDLPYIHDKILEYIKPSNIMISSFNPSLLSHFPKKGVKLGLLIDERFEKEGLSGLEKAMFKIKPYSLNLPVQMFDEIGDKKSIQFLRLLKLQRKKIAFWTVNTEEEYNKVKKYADFIITNEVEKMLKLYIADCGFEDVKN